MRIQNSASCSGTEKGIAPYNRPGTTLDRFTEYEYGTGNNGTQQTKKTVHNGLVVSGTTLEQTAFAYDLQGKMAAVTVTTNNASGVATRIEKTTYDYDDSGFRFSANTRRLIICWF